MTSLFQKISFLSVLASISFFTACSSDTTTDGGLQPSPKTGGTLERATNASLTAYFREAQNGNNRVSGADDNVALEASADGASPPTANSVSFSGTTLQEAGVDEADWVKTDGEFIYSIFQNDRNNFTLEEGSGFAPNKPNEFSQGIRIMQTSGTTLNEIKSISLSDTTRLSGIYLANKDLIAVGSGGNNVAYDWFNSFYFGSQTTELQWINVSEPANATLTNKLSFDGNLVSSRRVGNVLYLMLRHYPNFEVFPVEPNSQDGSTRPENNADTNTATAEDFLPKVQFNEQPKQIAVKPENCFINTGARGQQADIITLAAINLSSDGSEFETTCFVGSSEALYASTKALYLASTRWDYNFNSNVADYAPAVTTDIHKFAFSGLDFDYRGSAEIGGHLGWLQDRKSYRMSESADGEYLRIITHNEQRPWIAIEILPASDDVAASSVEAAAIETNERAAASSPVMLTILKENSQKAALDIVSQLPNQNSPASIGKTGEQLYASRFIGDRAYLVTFRITDPLYVLDLSNPQAPELKGELEIDGYSDFLFPAGNNLLLGVGKDAIAAEDAFDFRGGAWYQGVKLSLIDVADPSNPTELDKVIIGKRGTESPALQNPHAITLLNSGTNGITRVALPITLNETLTSSNIGPRTYYNYTQTGLYRFEVDQVSKSIVALPPLVTHQNSNNSFAPANFNSRSVIIDDTVHYQQNNQFWSQDWAGKLPSTGPK